MESPLKTVTVVIPTYQRKDRLARVLTGLAHQTVANFDAVIVDDGSTDGSCDAFRRDVTPGVRVVDGG
ncbi:MAG: glycosyltransferase family 2 protein, partial [Myxococcales bacterium]